MTWTKGIDPKTGKPLDYDPTKDLQTYADPIGKILTGATRELLSGRAGRQQFLVGGLQRRDQPALHPGARGLHVGHPRPDRAMCAGKFDGGKFAYDGRGSPAASSCSIPRPARSRSARRCPIRTRPARSRPRGGLIVTALLDGTIVALDDETLEELWSINVGTGINAPPITYAVDGKQYIAIATGLTRNQIGPDRQLA